MQMANVVLTVELIMPIPDDGGSPSTTDAARELIEQCKTGQWIYVSDTRVVAVRKEVER